MRNRLVPRLRFKEFNKDWHNGIFNDFLKVKDGARRGPFGSSLRRKDFVKDSSYVVYEQYNAINDKYNTRYYISKDKFDKLHQFHLKPNDFIMSGAGTIGKISKVPNNIKPGVFNQALIRFRTNNDTDPIYFLQLMESYKMQYKLTNSNPGSAIKNLMPIKFVKRLNIVYPSIYEQQKIGQFFSKLDRLIELQSQKLSHLKQLKKGYLQKMFPQKGESVPRLRFDGFRDKWNYKQLNELGNIITGNTPSTKDKYNYDINGISWITPTDISNNTVKNTNMKLSSKGASKSKIVPQNSILITCIGDIGHKTLAPSTTGFNQQINALVPQNSDYYFLYSRFSIIGRILNQFSSKGIMPIINKKDFSKISFSIPDIQEQNKIGIYFKIIDKYIEEQEHKLIYLKQLKKAYLQKMLI